MTYSLLGSIPAYPPTKMSSFFPFEKKKLIQIIIITLLLTITESSYMLKPFSLIFI